MTLVLIGLIGLIRLIRLIGLIGQVRPNCSTEATRVKSLG
jgi:hypothetical protein